MALFIHYIFDQWDIGLELWGISGQLLNLVLIKF